MVGRVLGVSPRCRSDLVTGTSSPRCGLGPAGRPCRWDQLGVETKFTQETCTSRGDAWHSPVVLQPARCTVPGGSMSNVATAPATRRAVNTPFLTPGTRAATALAVLVAQVGLAIPAVLNGLFQQDLHTNSSQLTWISDAFLVPVALLELTWGVLGDLFGRKRLLVGGSLLMAVGELISVLTPSPGASNTATIATLWVGQALTG